MSFRSTASIAVILMSALAVTTCAAGSAVGTVVASADQAGASADRLAGHARTGVSAFTKTFYVESKGCGRFLRSTAGGHSVFWTAAEMIEMSEDVYQSSGSPADKRRATTLINGFIVDNGTVWTHSRWNDDIMWMIIASARAYELTGNVKYRTLAKLNFDRCYARAWSNDFGGGLWWTTQCTGKNTTTAAPAVIAACKLYQDLHDKSYLSKAVSLYGWMRSNLFNAQTGEVYDTVVAAGNGMTVLPGRYTYNQGTFIGGADLLHALTGGQQYYSDALCALAFTRAHLTTRGILQREGDGRGSNRGGFKGIFVRWALKFVRDNHVTTYDAWFKQNASAAWAHRNRKGLMSGDWSRQTTNGKLYSFDCSSAVALLAVLNAASR